MPKHLPNQELLEHRRRTTCSWCSIVHILESVQSILAGLICFIFSSNFVLVYVPISTRLLPLLSQHNDGRQDISRGFSSAFALQILVSRVAFGSQAQIILQMLSVHDLLHAGSRLSVRSFCSSIVVTYHCEISLILPSMILVHTSSQYSCCQDLQSTTTNLIGKTIYDWLLDLTVLSAIIINRVVARPNNTTKKRTLNGGDPEQE